MWKGRTCNSRSTGCRFAHPTPCFNRRCATGPINGCRAFHPRVSGYKTGRDKGNDKGDVRKGGAVPKGKKRDSGTLRPNPNHRKKSTNATSLSNSNRSSSGRNSNSNRSSNLQLQERVASMEKQLGGMSRPSYRDVASRGIPTTSNSSAGSGSSSSGSSGGSNGNYLHHLAMPSQGRGGPLEGYALARPDPAVLNTVVAAVMAVLSGGQHF